MEDIPKQVDLAYGLDQRPPLGLSFLLGLQWVVIFLPTITVVTTVVGELFGLGFEARAAFFERTLIIGGLVITAQTVRGHRLPIVEGPAMALLLAMAASASAGPEASAGGLIVGGFLLFLISALRLTRFILPLFTHRIIGVILVLISLTIVPYLMPMLIGLNKDRPQGDPFILLLSIGLVLLTAFMSFRFKGWLKTLSLFLGITIGTILFGFLGLVDLSAFRATAWVACPDLGLGSWPRFDPAVVFAFVLAYLAVLANATGSIVGLGEVLGAEDMDKRLDRGLALTGFSGVLAGLTGVLGLVPYSNSPGVVSITRVGSRFVLTVTGLILILLAFLGKVTALLTAVPDAVAAAVLLTAMAAQLGVSIRVIMPEGESLSGRDFLVIGLPVLIGTMTGLFPAAFLARIPDVLRPILGNGLIVGLILALILEHVLLRGRDSVAI